MPLFLILLLLFIVVPMAEIYVMIAVGREIGAFNTIVALVVIAAAGSWLLRYQGLRTLAEVQAALARGEPPAAALIDGLVLILAGALLLAPGFLTDLLAFLCLLPPVRRALGRQLGRAMIARAFGRDAPSRPGSTGPRETNGPRVLEGDYRVEKER